MSTTGGFGVEGAAAVPIYAPGLIDDEQRPVDEQVEDATPDEVAEEAAVVEHLDDPEVEEAIEHLRAAQD